MNMNQESKFIGDERPIAVWNAVIGRHLVARDQHGCMWLLEVEMEPCVYAVGQEIGCGWKRMPLWDKEEEKAKKVMASLLDRI